MAPQRNCWVCIVASCLLYGSVKVKLTCSQDIILFLWKNTDVLLHRLLGRILKKISKWSRNLHAWESIVYNCFLLSCRVKTETFSQKVCKKNLFPKWCVIFCCCNFCKNRKYNHMKLRKLTVSNQLYRSLINFINIDKLFDVKIKRLISKLVYQWLFMMTSSEIWWLAATNYQ